MNNFIGYGFLLLGILLFWLANLDRKNTEGEFKYHLFVKGVIVGIICVLIGICCLFEIIDVNSIF